MEEIEKLKAKVIVLENFAAIQQRLDDSFLRALLTQLLLAAPQFDAQAFLDKLHQDQANLPTPSQGDDHLQMRLREVALSHWKRKIDLAEQAIEKAEAIREAAGTLFPPE